jgi:RNA polymerase sigma-70 factor (ECF subfamily)
VPAPNEITLGPAVRKEADADGSSGRRNPVSRFGSMREIQGVTEDEAAPSRHYPEVYRYVRRRSQSREDAEDVTQTVFAQATAGLERSTAGSPPALAWLYTVARRRLIDEHRRRYATEARVIPLDEARLEHREPEDYGIAIAQALAHGIASLPAEQREVVVLKVVEGRRFAEIAARLGVSEEACRTRLSRALRSLRTRLEEEGITP